MAVSKTVIRLVSALRAAGSRSAIADLPRGLFTEEEYRLVDWLSSYVRQHKSFPTPATFRRETGQTLVKITEPLSYYVDEARKRALYNALHEPYKTMRESMQDMDPDAIVRQCQDIIALSRTLDITGSNGVVTLDAALDMVIEDEEEAFNHMGLRGVTTGWPYVDDIMGGHQNGDLNTLVGRPGRGKTFLMLKQAHSAWADGRSVLFVSMEMNALAIARRVIGIDKGINPDYIRKGTLSTHMHRQFREAVQTMKGGVPFNFIAGDFRKSVPAVRALAEETLPDIIYVDASYLLTPEKKRGGSSGRREVISDVIEELKQVGLDVNRPMVNSVQFNRQAVKPKRAAGQSEEVRANPIAHLDLSKIGETDVVGQVSSVVFGIENGDPPYENSRKWMGFLKGREGEQGHWAVNYQFNPVNFDIITNPRETSPEEQYEHEIDLDFMV